MDNFKIIYKILKHLEKSMDYEEVDTNYISADRLGISKIRIEELFIMLSNAGYITGITVEQNKKHFIYNLCIKLFSVLHFTYI